MITESEILKHRKSIKSQNTNITMKNVLYNMILLLVHKHADIYDYAATALSVGK